MGHQGAQLPVGEGLNLPAATGSNTQGSSSGGEEESGYGAEHCTDIWYNNDHICPPTLTDERSHTCDQRRALVFYILLYFEDFPLMFNCHSHDNHHASQLPGYRMLSALMFTSQSTVCFIVSHPPCHLLVFFYLHLLHFGISSCWKCEFLVTDE